MKFRRTRFRRIFGVGILAGVLCCLKPAVATAQTYVPGNAYFGRSNYTEYVVGDLPLIVSAPHGGLLTPAEIPDRVDDGSDPDYTTVTDSNTEETALAIQAACATNFGHLPHIILCNLKRTKIDCNRSLDEGVYNTNVFATQAWNEFQSYINISSNAAIAESGRGFYIDQHGQGHPIQRLELGYLLTTSQLMNSDTTLNSPTYRNQTSIRTLGTLVSNQFNMPFSRILRGSGSFGSLMMSNGFPSVPSPAMPDPGTTNGTDNPYFDGGYNTATHCSLGNNGVMDGLQIEANYNGVRDSDNSRNNYAFAVVQALDFIFTNYYKIDLRITAPCRWTIGSGKWATAANWGAGILPVAGNYLLFSGSGGAVSNNLPALTTGTGRVYSLLYATNASGSYTNYGAPVSLVAGITNFSAWPQSVSNQLTLLAAQTFTASNAPLTFYGNVTNGGFQLAVNATTNVTVNAIISGAGGLTKSGPGVLALTALNAYTGPTTNLSGTITLNATSSFGVGTNPLVFAGGNILVLNTRSTAPLSNAVMMTADTVIAGNGNLTNSNRILTFGADSIVTAGGTLTIRNSSTNTTATNNAFRVRFTGGGFNFAQPVVIGDPSDVPAASSQLESYNDLGTADQTFSGVISGPGQFRRDAAVATAAGRTILTGANTYAGGTTVFAGTLLVNNPAGSATGTGNVVISNNSVLSGTGIVGGPVAVYGSVSPGNPVGVLTITNGLVFTNGGSYNWTLAANTTNSPGVNFDQIVLSGGALILSSNSPLNISFTNAATAPATGNAFWQAPRSWKIISLAAAATNLNLAPFNLIVSNTYPAGKFTSTADAAGNVFLNFLPTPPPVISSSLSGAGTTSVGISWSAVAGVTYQVQYATNLTQPAWQPLGSVTATDTNASLPDTSPVAPQRFYRVVIP